METDAVDELPLLPLKDIKTDSSDEELHTNEPESTSNTVLLLEDVKVEPNTDAVALVEDPLNIGNKLDTRVDIKDVTMGFKGEYNESDFISTDASVSTEVDDQRHKRNKRMRASTEEMKARNGYTWSTNKPAATVDSAEMALITPLTPQGKGPAKVAANLLEVWHLLVDDPMLLSVFKHTNDEMRKRRGKNPASGHRRGVDMLELRAWIGLNYLCGVFRVGGSTLEELWSPELGIGVFRATMSLKRFQYIRDCLRLHETIIKSKHDFASEIQDVREVWEKFIINCRSYYAASGICVLEEHIVDMAGTDCPKSLSVCIPQKPLCHGIRIVSLHDAKTLYMCNAIIGQSETPIKEEALALICDMKGTRRNVTSSQRYTSLELANQLLQCQLTLVGGLSAKAKDVPAEFCSANSRRTARKLYSGQHALLALQNSTTEVLLASGTSQQVDVEKLYTATVQSGQRFYQSACQFSTSAAYEARTGSEYSWVLRFFHSILDFACLNAWLLFRLSQHGDTFVQQRDFQRQLGLFLTQQHLKRRIQRNSKLPLHTKLLISEILGESVDNLLSEAVSAAAQASSVGEIPVGKAEVPSHVQLLQKTTPKRGRCRCCPPKNNIKTRWQCQQCARSLCLQHLIMRCGECTGLSKKPKNEEKDPYFQ